MPPTQSFQWFHRTKKDGFHSIKDIQKMSLQKGVIIMTNREKYGYSLLGEDIEESVWDTIFKKFKFWISIRHFFKHLIIK